MSIYKLSDAIAVAFNSLLTHKMRTFLTMLGIIFGVGAVISMMSIGEGAEAEAMAIIDAMGKRNVYAKAKEWPRISSMLPIPDSFRVTITEC